MKIRISKCSKKRKKIPQNQKIKKKKQLEGINKEMKEINNDSVKVKVTLEGPKSKSLQNSKDK